MPIVHKIAVCTGDGAGDALSRNGTVEADQCLRDVVQQQTMGPTYGRPPEHWQTPKERNEDDEGDDADDPGDGFDHLHGVLALSELSEEWHVHLPSSKSPSRFYDC